MEKNKFSNTNIPVTFQKINQFDDRFVQVKIFLMHLGLNYNGSIFTKESVVSALPSLKNTPILGYIQQNSIGQEDFKGHEMELVVENGDYKMKYIGSAFGVIPESNNARWEKKVGDDGLERDYLVVDGLMWTKFDDATGIINRDEIKGQSMELNSDYDGHFDANGNFVFTKFSFYGACILGDGVDPAMQRATIEKTFSADQLKSEVNSMMEEFKLNYGSLENKEKEGYTVDLEKILSKFGVTAEQLIEKGIIAEEFSTEEELEAKITEAFAEGETPKENEKPEGEFEAGTEGSEEGEQLSVEPQGEPEGEPEGEEGNPTPEGELAPEGEFEAPKVVVVEGEQVVRQFAMSHSDVRVQLYDKLDSYVVDNQLGNKYDFWIHEVYDDHAIVQNESNRTYQKISYSKEGDNLTLGNHVQVFSQYLTAEEKGALELMRNNYTLLEGEVTQLKEFKKQVVDAEHEATAENMFEQSGLEAEDYKDLKENVHNYSIQDIEDKLYARLGRKNFSIKVDKPNKVAFSQEGNIVSGKSYGYLFTKHGKK